MEKALTPKSAGIAASNQAMPALTQGQRWRWLREMNVTIRVATVVLLIMVLAVVLADFIAPGDPTAQSLRARLTPPLTNPDYLLGTDGTGRDLLMRLLHGGRVSLLIGITATIIGTVVGVALGVVSGYARGWVDEVISYVAEVQLSLPFVLLAIAVALVLGRSLAVLIGLAALSTWPLYSRVVRGEVLSLREREFVVAARALGGNSTHIILRHLLPNIAAPILVLATINIGRIILLESGLSFLGIGIQPPTPSWGNMISDGREVLPVAWWISTLPALALMLLTLAIGTLGDWLRDVLDVAVG
ncbi:MAG: ABC transporter permease [Chloroflexota bacterium]|nr:ABC transporter permease [Chloroflexota bacterium]